MVWSKWSPAAVMMLACVGVTWSQTPVPTSSVGTGMLTIHENGKSLRCRIISNWSTPDGSKAYQLQTIDNGEMITIVEDGPATTLQKPLLAGKLKSLPMRIFHWGNSRVAPPGVPTPPAGVATAPDTIVVTRPATLGAPMSQGNATKDQVMWWEEKNGKRVSPVIVTNGKNPVEQTGTIITLPGPAEAPRMATSAPVVRTLAQAYPSGPVTSIPISTTATSDSAVVQTIPTTPYGQPVPPLGVPPDARGPTPTTAAVAGNFTPATPVTPTPRPTLKEKISNFFHPKKEATAAGGTPDTKPAANLDQSKDSYLATTKAAAGSVPFSTATGNGDILLNPEKFDPAGDKLTPKGINMNAYRGDPANLMTKNGGLPPGAQSVLAAGANVPTNVTYVPVPMATLPDTNRPPMPPSPNLPEPPRPNSYSNAFSPPPPLPDNRQNPMMAGAFVNSNQPAPRYPQLPGGDPAYLPSPDLTKAPQQVQPIQYSPASVPPPVNNPAMDRRQSSAAGASGSELERIIQVLRESSYPAQREWAANTLATYDSRDRPDVVQLLMTVAQQDPAATVRAACVYSLGRTKSASEPVLNVLYTLRNDSDPRVREEVERALVRLAGTGKQ